MNEYVRQVRQWLNSLSKRKVLFMCSLFLVALGAFLYIQYVNKEKSAIEQSLVLAGNNRNELEKVLIHFKKTDDKLKYKAALFLIKNLRNKIHFQGESVEIYKKAFSKMYTESVGTSKKLPEKWDAIRNSIEISNNSVRRIYDAEILSSELLISHINAAFISWSYPWSRHLSFGEFCELILPYKLVNEEPEDWMAAIQEEYQWVIDSMKGSTDPQQACLLINKTLAKSFYIGNTRFNWDVRYSDLRNLRIGSCYHATQFSAYVLRSMGIPVAMDFTTFWANKSGGHTWNALIIDNRPIPFVGTESDPGKTKVEAAYNRRRAKILRRTFAIQPDESNLIDVTAEYCPVSTVNLPASPVTEALPQICIFNAHQWRPIFLGNYEKDQATFKDLARNIVYLPTYSRYNTVTPISAPFILTKSGNVVTLPGDSKRLITVRASNTYPNSKLVKKDCTYTLYAWRDKWMPIETLTADTNFIEYKSVPVNSLLLLEEEEGNNNSRIFTFNGKDQVWW